MLARTLFAVLLMIGALRAQEVKDGPRSEAAIKAILERLDLLEKQNHALADEVHALREELGARRPQLTPESVEARAAPAPLEERVTVAEQRVDELAQTKLEASQKFPVSVSGMLLFNSFLNSHSRQAPESYYLLNGPNEAGATLRQTLLGLKFRGPSLPGGGKVNGNLLMDFYSGGPYPSSSFLHLRTAELSFDWANRSFTVGQQKPLISPRNPDSLAEIGVPPLSGSGNFWLWLPQARYEERVHWGANMGLIGQIAVMQTQETYAYVPYAYASLLEKSRPAIEGRLAFWRKWGDNTRIEFAPGFHSSTTHIAGVSIPSRIATVDWLVNAGSKVQLSGTLFAGRNMGNLGAMPESFTVLPSNAIVPVRGRGGWFQGSYSPTTKVTFNLFSGLQANRARDLSAGSTLRDFTYAANVLYHLGPNVLVGLEALQLRALLLGNTKQLYNHYDLSLAYLF